MFLGHYGLALAARPAARETSLGALVTAAQWADLLWPPLLLVGLERVRVVPGLMAASSLDFEHYPITHSLAAVLGWAALFGGAYLLARRSPRGAAVLAALVVSHWILDALAHGPDLPLWPGSDVRVGAGVWRSVTLTLVLELGLLGAGVATYTRVTRPRDGVGRWGLWIMLAVLVAFYLMGLSAPPPSRSALAWGGLVLWVFVPWAWWVDRHRALGVERPEEGAGP
ncbi:MAG: metal-dependent hydrolase [Gemmatimonadota bacterium]|jgi:membrane-bound metal-dependent hydrolase YbcI (DUF457 family)